MAPVLQLENLRTEFRMRTASVVAVAGVSLDVGEGECVGVVGESGCGKSTTGLSIMRLLPGNGHVTGGTISLLGRDLAGLDEKAMRRVRGNEVALIPQDPMTSLNPTMTIGRQISEGVRLHRDVSRQQARERALEVLRLVEMPQPAERLDQYPHELSGGLRQRVMIAMALACEPKLLIADEPTTALDVTIQAQILDLIDDLRQRLAMSVVLITHDMGVIAGRTDRVVVMYAGRVAEEAETGELFNRIHHPYSEALLASVPKLDQSRDERLASIPGLPPDLSQTITNCRFAPRCQYATDQCRSQDPPLVDGRDGAGPVHRFACFHPVGLDNPVRTDAPDDESPDDQDPADRRGPEAAATSAGSPVEVSPPQVARAESLASAERILQVQDLVKEFPVMSGTLFRHQVGSVKAVSGLTFDIRKGETFGLVGESGCGKTTVGRLLVSLDRATAGSIRFEGVELSSLGASELRTRRRDLQLMFQDPYASLDPRMRVGTIIREPLKVNAVGDRASQDDKVASLLDEVGLSRTSVERYPHEFSGGQRQRIGLARALALDPKIIVADEPVSALDVSIQAQILNLMKDLQARHDLTYVMISHDLAVVRYMADTIAVMYLGKMVEQGPAAEIYARPAHHYTVGLLEAVPVIDVASARLRARQETRVKGELPSSINPPSGCRFRTRCPAAQDLCAQVEPPLSDFGNGHVAACHFPLQPTVAPSVTGSAAAASS
ncbi:MAG: ABC transporter ATP-binding protein [Acidimicrobiales bacterium]|jgi:peptide/nickel transport system ATP-binding protein